MIPVLLFVAICALLFLSLVETAFGLLMRLPQRLEAERENEGGALATYLDDPLTFFVPARLMRGLALVLIVVLLAQLLGRGWVPGLIVFASGLGAVVGAGLVLPALIVRRAPERVLDLLLPAFTLVANILGPLTAVIIGWLGAPERPTRRENGVRPDTAEPNQPDDDEAQGRSDENRLLRSVVDFGDTLVREVMTPRPDIAAIPSDATVRDLRRFVREQEYSRLPVFTENLDNIVGLIVVKDLIQLPDIPADDERIAPIMRPAAFVPETKRVADLLREFQQGRFQLAIVVDEYGGTAGLVTIEDVVEELVGEIRDEYDLEAELIVHESDDTFVFSAKVGIPEMRDRLEVEVEDGDFETVGGYVLARVGRVPAVGEHFRLDGLEVEILEAERRRIHKVRIRRVPEVVSESTA
jgi:CBS domain containing-hemolysin-like protein